MRSMQRVLERRSNLSVGFEDEVLHSVERMTTNDVFVFPYGVVVIWEMVDSTEDAAVLAALRPFQRTPLPEAEYDGFRFEYDGETPRMSRDVITLPERASADEDERRSEEILERLAVSHAMAQSVRLTCFEESVQKTVAATRHLPEEMARDGMISKSRADVSRYMGRLITDRHAVFLYADVLDIPEFFWENERFEPQYRIAERYLELRQRVEVLNRRVEVVRDLFELLGQELQFRHSSKLEVIIILLITFEILLTLVKDGLQVLSVRRAGGRVDMLSALGLIFVVSVVSLAVAALVIYVWNLAVKRFRPHQFDHSFRSKR